MFVKEVITRSPEETEGVGAALGVALRGGETIELVSDLGGGKTTFVRGLVRGMGSEDRVTSPTFTVARQYVAGPLTLHHFDFYRLPEAGILADELEEILASPQHVTVVEWGDIVRDILPAGTVTIAITPLGEMERRITITYDENHAYLLEESNI